MEVEKHISGLLYDHDCVIIPHFGGFVANHRSARLDRVQHKFCPPFKEISFNKNLTHNDGLLASRISVEDKKSFEEVCLLLKHYSDNLKISLQQGKKIEFKKVGVLFADEQKNLRFEPDNSTNFLTDSYGLAPFHAAPVTNAAEQTSTLEKIEIPIREKAAEITFTDRIPTLEETPPGTVNKRISLKSRAGRYFAYSAAALPLLLFLLWLPFNAEKLSRLGQKASSISGKIQYSNLIPFLEKATPAYTLREKSAPGSLPVTHENTALSFPDSASITVLSFFDKEDPEYSEDKKIIVRLKELPDATAVSTLSPVSTQYRFHVIAGCFQYYENAEKMMSQLRDKGFNAAIVDKHKGLYRVCYQSFLSRHEALRLLAQLSPSQNEGAWVLVK